MMEIRAYDPRDSAQREHDPSTWKPTRNFALIAAHMIGGLPVDWPSVASTADALDECVVGGCEECGADDQGVSVEAFEITGRVLCEDCADSTIEEAAESDS